MKKIVCLICAIVLILSMNACSAQKKFGTADNEIFTYTPLDSAKKQLTVAITGTINVTPIVEKFEKDNPDVQVTVLDYTGGSPAYRKDGVAHDVFRVRDTGIGMSEDFIQNCLYKPFMQESSEMTSQYVGTGLGLSIVKYLVELLGGRIEVESVLGEGTTFTLYLNFERVENEEARVLVTAQEGNRQRLYEQLNGKTVLLCEDHPLNAHIAKRLLENMGMSVLCAENGKLGVETFAASEPYQIDAILMDIRMPVLDGLEAARTIRSLVRSDAKTVPIIAMSANAFDEDVEKSMEAGMNAHLAKPIIPQMMYETIEQFLQRKPRNV